MDMHETLRWTTLGGFFFLTPLRAHVRKHGLFEYGKLNNAGLDKVQKWMGAVTLNTGTGVDNTEKNVNR